MALRELSVGKFHEAYEIELLEISADFQLIEIKFKEIAGNDQKIAVFSDGTYFDEMLIHPNRRYQFEEAAGIYNVYRLRFCFNNYGSFKHLLLLDFVTKFTGITERIGKPIRFRLESPKQSRAALTNMIPSVAVKVSSSSNETETEERNSPYQKFLKKRDRSDFEEAQFTEIAQLSIGDKLRVIKGRVVLKSELRDFQKNNGKFFSITLRDKSGEIRAVFFKSVAEQYYNQIKEGNVYSVAGGEIEKASTFNSTNNPIEMILKDNVIVQELKNDNSIPVYELNYFTIADILEQRDNELVDVVALVTDIADQVIVSEVKKENPKKLKKITIIDQSRREMNVCVWGNSFDRKDIHRYDLCFFRGLKLKTYNKERYLQWDGGSRVEYSIPNVTVLRKLTSLKEELISNKTKQPFKNTDLEDNLLARRADNPNRFEATKRTFTPPPPSPPDTKPKLDCISEMIKRCHTTYAKESNRGLKLFFDVTATIVSLQKIQWYESCGFRNCKKKLIRKEGRLFCDKCNIEVEKPVLKFMSQVRIIDSLAFVHARIFGEENCKSLFLRTPDELCQMYLADESAYTEWLKQREREEFYCRFVIKYSANPADDHLTVEILTVFPIDTQLKLASQYLIEQLDGREKRS